MPLHNVSVSQVFIKADYLGHPSHDLDMEEYENGFITFVNRTTGESKTLERSEWLWYNTDSKKILMNGFEYDLCRTITVGFDL